MRPVRVGSVTVVCLVVVRRQTHLGKVLADVVGRGAEIVAKGTGIAGLAGALSKELAGDMSSI